MTQFRIGRFTCAVIDAGRVGPSSAADLCLNVPEHEAVDYVGGAEILAGMNCLMLRDGENVILIDSGLGAFAPDGPERLRAGLDAHGVSPEDVSMVLTSHTHRDHIGGHVMEGAPAFPRARYLFSKVEWDHAAISSAEATQSILPVLADADVVEWLPSGEVLPGIEVIDAPGHTPGHVAFGISDEGMRCLYLADSFLYPRHLERPELYSRYDWDGPMSVETRKKLIGRAAAERATVVVYHLDAPGLGTIEEADRIYRWVPTIPPA
ncbi:MAG TPA: MBL fold metallo-hydrolase [Actinomycetota bacterium]|nr:MBL fold metallo-hydrolase [Actinomycetota bacterium]